MVGGAYLLLRRLREGRAQGLARARGGHRAPRGAGACRGGPRRRVVALKKEPIEARLVRTDFILSAEIVVITLGTVAAAAPHHRMYVLTAIALP